MEVKNKLLPLNMSNKETLLTMENLTLQKQTEERLSFEFKHLNIYKRGFKTMIKENPTHAETLQAEVNEALQAAGVDSWDALTLDSAMSLNIYVQRRLAALKGPKDKRTPEEIKAGNDRAIGQMIENARKQGKRYLMD